ncbi:LIC12192 family sporadic carbohydrate cluster protein [Synechococcus sp. A15-24]|uniref:LIC12192 family sporadic carbohydrate cluster protein n=1 Tax=Synechococcus sp. A15-24 TaxID=1050635 RepID=UPI001645B3D0|nr:LIC12192 family sporadic carbohydrate cluster protein [Synechococcus sp. A15-24]QNJ27837.1 sporadic carbohydrate cluster/ LIC12192 family protein [Synechococcus sp. A15-24]
MNPARGYIASGEFNGHRVPQHIQNQIVKTYCDANNLKFVLSRAEYWINGSTDCQLWAALKEGFQHIVFYSIWQLPEKEAVREKVYKYCIKNKIILHFAVEQIRSGETNDTFTQFETLIKSNLLILNEIDYEVHLNCLTKLLQQSGDNI